MKILTPQTIKCSNKIGWEARQYAPVEIRLLDAIAILEEKLNSIPENSRETATFNVVIDDFYEDTALADCFVYWKRQESADELAKRQDKHEKDSQRAKVSAENRRLAQQKRERETYERLKSKYAND